MDRAGERIARIAVLVAAAREAEEILAEPGVPDGAREEAQRRIDRCWVAVRSGADGP